MPAANNVKSLTPEAVKALQANFQTELRPRGDQLGLVKVFSPEWYQKADGLAKQGAEALAGNRLVEARDYFRRARWHLPALPAGAPPHVAHILGDGRLRHTHWVQCVAFSPDGKKLATVSQDGTVKVWDVETGRELIHYAGHTDSVRGVAFSPDGKNIASGGADKEVRIWDSATGKDVQTLPGHTESLTCVAYSPDGVWLATGGVDRKLRLYDVASGALKHELLGHNLLINAVAFSGDSKMVTSVSGDRLVAMWDAAPAAGPPPDQPLQGQPFAVAFHPNAGKQLFVGGADPNAVKLIIGR